MRSAGEGGGGLSDFEEPPEDPPLDGMPPVGKEVSEGNDLGVLRLTSPDCCIRWNGGVRILVPRSIFSCGTTGAVGVFPLPVLAPVPGAGP